uniref:kelch-like protein 24 n=1 Tax=Styela clava TaxID=7725 RepID=UPI00193A4E0D|nr:kelch-like protein 24 [Styela clava]
MARKYPSERLEDVFQEEIVQAFPKIVNFNRFARSSAGLCLDKHEFDHIVEDHGKSVEEQKMQMLMKWKKNAGSAATVSKIRALLRGYQAGDSNEEATKVFNANDDNVIILSFFDEFRFYKPATKEWREWKNISWLSDVWYSIIAMDGYLYVLVGNCEVRRTKYADPKPKWERLSDMKCNHGLWPPTVAINGCIYVCGGRGSNSRSVERYNPTNNEWQQLESMKIEIGGPTVVAATGRLYCFARFNETHQKSESGEVFDPESSKWEFTAPMPIGIGYANAAQSNDFIYIVGDRILLCYDINNNSWEKISLQNQLPDFDWTFRRIVALNNEIYFVIYAKSTYSLYKFDPKTNQTEHVETDRRFLCASITVGHV